MRICPVCLNPIRDTSKKNRVYIKCGAPALACEHCGAVLTPCVFMLFNKKSSLKRLFKKGLTVAKHLNLNDYQLIQTMNIIYKIKSKNENLPDIRILEITFNTIIGGV
jgi:hypothetical protein